MKKVEKLEVRGRKISLMSKRKDDFISLTDIARYKSDRTGMVISHWLSTRYTVEFLGIWEELHNNNFNVTEFRDIKNEVSSNGFILYAKKWISKTNSIGLISKTGRYGGTYAHKDIAFEFASWISAEFKLFLIKEFQRLKEEESKRESLDWNVKRILTKTNYKIHTDAVRKKLVPEKITKKQAGFIYASEADVLNKALFGFTAKEWRDDNKGKKGNVRDYADVLQLVCLANLESLNAEFIRQGMSQGERLLKLNKIAIVQMRSLVGSPAMKELR